MGTASFKTFGYPGQTSNTRVPIDAEMAIQQMKAGFDEEEAKRIKNSKKNVQQVQNRLARARLVQPKRRFIM